MATEAFNKKSKIKLINIEQGENNVAEESKEEEEKEESKEEEEKEESKEEEEEKRKKEEKAKGIAKENGFKYIRKMGSGTYGAVVEVEKDKKIFAIKVAFNQKKPELTEGFKGKNIVKILQKNIFEKDGNYYYVMERSCIGTLKELHKFINIKLIFKDAFVENIGDNLTRFFVQQIVSALTTLYLGNLVHFDIKPSIANCEIKYLKNYLIYFFCSHKYIYFILIY